MQAVRDAVKQYATLLDNIKTNQNGIASDEDIQNLDKYEKKIKNVHFLRRIFKNSVEKNPILSVLCAYFSQNSELKLTLYLLRKNQTET